ncbi:MAG: hypothetical protein DRG50_09910 [Deltaproteobacteria bacterium]|nr:MAG: hypothetical protein DRG50_09910 [Deltaproteobacteria bacterium]
MQLIVSSIILSSMYALLGCGFVTIYKASRVLNFAYADLALVIGYLAATMASFIGGPVVVPIGLSLLFSFVLGLVIYILLVRPMIGEPLLATIILTVALGIILNALAVLIWRGSMENISLGWRAYYRFPWGVAVSSTEIITLICTVVIFFGLWAFYRFSKIGRHMRAAAENILLSAQRGINIFFVTGVAWGIGVFVTGMAGVLFGANYGVSLHMGNMVIKGLAVALVGGLDSLGGAIPGALIIAFAEKLTVYYFNPRLADSVPFMIMMVVLLVKPWGILGTEEELERV